MKIIQKIIVVIPTSGKTSDHKEFKDYFTEKIIFF